MKETNEKTPLYHIVIDIFVLLFASLWLWIALTHSREIFFPPKQVKQPTVVILKKACADHMQMMITTGTSFTFWSDEPCFQELNLTEAVNLIIHANGYAYVPEQTGPSTPAHLVK